MTRCNWSPHIIFVASNSLVQAILIMGGQWMMKVNNGLDDLEGDIKSLKIPADDMKALREEQEKHKVNKHVYIVKGVVLDYIRKEMVSIKATLGLNRNSSLIWEKKIAPIIVTLLSSLQLILDLGFTTCLKLVTPLNSL